MQLVKKMAQIGVESAFEVMVKARALEATGKSVIHLEIGEPDFPTPRNVIEAGKKALDEGWTKYGPTQGLPELRQSIASLHFADGVGLRLVRKTYAWCRAVSRSCDFVIIALLEEGDEKQDLSRPWVSHLRIDDSFSRGRSRCRFRCGESRGFSLDINELKDRLTDRTKLVILNSPHNPTGGIIPGGDIQEIAVMLRDRDVMVLSDEIYSRIIYDGEPSSTSMDGMVEKTVILDGFSKTYSMTGWRLGYGVMPEWLADAVVKLMVNSPVARRVLRSARGLRRWKVRRDAAGRDGGGVQASAGCCRQRVEQTTWDSAVRCRRGRFMCSLISRARGWDRRSWRIIF